MSTYWGQLNSLNLKFPSSFSETNEVIGGYNVTLRGTKRRNIKAIKKIWEFTYDVLSSTEYDSLYAEFEKEDPSNLGYSQSFATFTLFDSNYGINGKNVHIDISPRNFIPGTNLLSNVTVTLTEI